MCVCFRVRMCASALGYFAVVCLFSYLFVPSSLVFMLVSLPEYKRVHGMTSCFHRYARFGS